LSTKLSEPKQDYVHAVQVESAIPAGPASKRQSRWVPWSAFALGAILVWAYWPTLCEIWDRWVNDSRYSHGYFVPVFSAWLLWLRRKQVAGKNLGPSIWGLAFLLLGLALHAAGARYYLDWISAASLLPCLAGLCLGLGGWKALGWAWLSIIFLVFMLPLPYRIEGALAQPLQRFATSASTYVLQTIGLPAVAEGNIILMEAGSIGVEEACNGLGMMVTFFALTTGLAMVIRRDWRDKVILILSAVPVALVANVVRITATGILNECFGEQVGQAFFHDLAGWFLMPFALGLLWLELWLLSHLFIDPSAEDPAGAFPKTVLVQSKRRPAQSGRKP
jgi:exosortase